MFCGGSKRRILKVLEAVVDGGDDGKRESGAVRATGAAVRTQSNADRERCLGAS